jgi:hypothetical protein
MHRSRARMALEYPYSIEAFNGGGDGYWVAPVPFCMDCTVK